MKTRLSKVSAVRNPRFAIAILVTMLLAVPLISQNFAFAQQNVFIPQPTVTIFFTNVQVDQSPVPNKPFTVYADIQSQNVNTGNLLVYVSPPPGLSVTSPIFAKTAFTNQGNTVRATWTFLTSTPGSYPISIIAKSNFPPDTQTFNLVVNVGSPHSLFVSGIDIPGNIYPNDNFTVGLKLKNALSTSDSNVNAQILVPAGLQLLDDVSKHSNSIGPGQEIALTWNLKAQTPGSYSLLFNYSSVNSGSGSTNAGVNVGSKPQITGGLISITTEASNVQPFSVNPITFNISNNGVQDVHDLQIVSATGNGYTSMNTPTWVGDLPINAKKQVTIQISTTNGSSISQIPVAVKYDSGGNTYQETYQTGLQLSNLPDYKISSVSATPPISYAGDTADKITVNIFNAGPGTNDVYATLSLPPQLSPAWGNATSTYFGRIGSFETVPATFYINIDSNAVSGSYPLTVVLTNGNQKTTLTANFVISQKAAFALVSQDDTQLYPGASNVPFKITLKNDGTATAQTITTKLLGGNAVPGVRSTALTTVGNVENIGTVVPGQIFTTEFLVSLDPSYSPGDQLSTVEIDWTQNGTNTFVQTVQVPYHVASGPSYLLYAGGVPITYVILAILAGAGLWVFISKRRERLQAIELAALQQRADAMTPIEFPTVEPIEDVSATKVNEPVFRVDERLEKEDFGDDDDKSPVKPRKIR